MAPSARRRSVWLGCLAVAVGTAVGWFVVRAEDGGVRAVDPMSASPSGPPVLRGLPQAGMPRRSVDAAPSHAQPETEPGDTVRKPGCRLTGSVLRADLSPAPDADVLLVHYVRSDIVLDTTTDAEGHYVLSLDAPRAPTKFWITVLSTHDGSGHGGPLVVEKAGHLEVADIVLQAPYVIEGQVRFLDGSPVGGAYVLALDDGEGPMLRNPWTGAEICQETEPYGISDPDGQYRLIVHDRVAYTLEVRSYPDNVRAPARAGDRSVDLEIDAHALRIDVVDEKGATLPMAKVSLRVWSADVADAVERDARAGRSTDAQPVVQRTYRVGAGFPFADLLPRGGLVWIRASLSGLETAEGSEEVAVEQFVRVPLTSNASRVEIRIPQR